MALWLTLRGVTIRMSAALAGIAMAGLLIVSVVDWTQVESPFERLDRVTSPELAASGRGGTVFTRVDGYRDAWGHIRRNPLIGVGLDEASSQRVLGPKTVHNFLINPWFSAGILGLIGIVMVIVSVTTTGIAAVRLSPASGRSLSTALLASLLVFIVFAAGEPIIFVRYGWFAAALLIALRSQQSRESVARSSRGRI